MMSGHTLTAPLITLSLVLLVTAVPDNHDHSHATDVRIGSSTSHHSPTVHSGTVPTSNSTTKISPSLLQPVTRSSPKTISELVSNHPKLSLLHSAIKTAHLETILSSHPKLSLLHS